MQTVRVTTPGLEALYVSITVGIILIIWGIGVASFNLAEVRAELLPYQINGYQSLKATEQGLYSDLENAGYEIDAVHDDNNGQWLSIAELRDNYFAPFLEDESWKRRGRLSWRHFVLDQDLTHGVMYVGISEDTSVSGSMLLFMEHKHGVAGEAEGLSDKDGEGEHFEIWYHPTVTALEENRQWREQELIRNGWKQVVPYRGVEELERLERKVEWYPKLYDLLSYAR